MRMTVDEGGFACFLTMIVVPVLYSIFFNVKEPAQLPSAQTDTIGSTSSK